MSRAVRVLGTRGPLLAWTVFFDDFVCLSRPEDAASADLTVRHLFQCLGWWVAEDKDEAFSSKFTALGVEFDLEHVGSGKFFIGNTESRKAELKKEVDAIVAADTLPAVVSEKLRSRMLFAESQVYGRCAKLSLRAIGAPGVGKFDESPLSKSTLMALNWTQSRILQSPPRLISSLDSDTYFLFIDGACEPNVNESFKPFTSVGGVLLTSTGTGVASFGEMLDDDIVRRWSSGCRLQLVFEAEVLPYYVALSLWKGG